MSVILMLRRPLLTSLASLLIVTGVASSTTLSFSTGTTITVSPGARVCLETQYATS